MNFSDKKLNYGRHIIYDWISINDNNTKQITVLDIGAGEGVDLKISEKKLGSKINKIAIESYNPFVELLRSQNTTVHSLNIEIDKLPIENESVDIIIANQILEHTKELFWILHELSRVLKVGGKIIIGVPNLAALHNRLTLLFGNQPTCIKTNSAHIRGFTKSGLLQIFNCWDEGYVLNKLNGSNFYPFPPSIANIFSKIFPSLSVSIFAELKKQKSYTGDDYLKFPIKNNLATNFYIGNYQSNFE